MREQLIDSVRRKKRQNVEHYAEHIIDGITFANYIARGIEEKSLNKFLIV